MPRYALFSLSAAAILSFGVTSMASSAALAGEARAAFTARDAAVSIHLARDGVAPWALPGDAVLLPDGPADGWPAAAIAFSILSFSASASGHGGIVDGDGWDLALYGTRNPEVPDTLPSGGLALSLHPDGGWVGGALSIDYASADAVLGEGSGLAFVASVDLLGSAGPSGAEPLLRLTYRLPAGFGPGGGGEEGQSIALRAGLRW